MKSAAALACAVFTLLSACRGHTEEKAALEPASGVEEKTVSATDCTLQPEPGPDALADALRDAPADAVICLRAGTYTRTHTFKRSVTVRGVEDGVVLDAGGEGPVLGVEEDRIRVVLENLTLTGGSAHAGGALPLEARSEVVLRKCTLRGNTATDYGGGAVFARRGKVVLEDCTVTGNRGRMGGGLLADGVSFWEVRGTAVTGNSGGMGGAMAARDGAQVTVEGCTFSGNEAKEAGGAAVWVDGTTTRGPAVTIKGSTLEGGSPAVHVASEMASVVVE